MNRDLAIEISMVAGIWILELLAILLAVAIRFENMIYKEVAVFKCNI